MYVDFIKYVKTKYTLHKNIPIDFMVWQFGIALILFFGGPLCLNHGLLKVKHHRLLKFGINKDHISSLKGFRIDWSLASGSAAKNFKFELHLKQIPQIEAFLNKSFK